VEAVLHANYVELENPMQRNITLALDDDLIRKAKVLAARRNSSVSALLREELSRLVSEDEAYETAKRAALERLERGSRLGGGPLPSRDELHERAQLR
jgi:predicted transcriptional regulator